MGRSLRAHERDRVLVRRPWTPAERQIVWNGLFGRAVIAIEPVICAAVFGFMFVALLTKGDDARLLAPIFGFATIAFTIYAVLVMVAPLRAIVQTYAPIYIVDGYVRYRRRDRFSDIGENGYVAVLNDERGTVAEWATLGPDEIVPKTRAALIEFSHYGGIHAIDGRPTGVLPLTLAPLGVGKRPSRRDARREGEDFVRLPYDG